MDATLRPGSKLETLLSLQNCKLQQSTFLGLIKAAKDSWFGKPAALKIEFLGKSSCDQRKLLLLTEDGMALAVT